MAKEKRKSRGADWDEVTPVSEGKRFDAEIDTYNFSDTTHTQIRLIGKVFAVKLHWVPTIRKDGSRGQFPKLCLHNLEDAEFCPYCKAGIKVSTRYFTNAIIRDLEEARPKKATYDEDAEFKKSGDNNWTPIRVVAFPASVMQKILNFKSLTKIKTKNGIETFHVSHPKYGRDLSVKIDASGTGSGMYDVQREAVSKLEGEEKSYLPYDIDTVYDAVETEDEAMATIKSCYDRGTFEGAKSKDGSALVDMSAVQKLLGVSSKKRHRDEDEEDDVPRKKKHSREDDDLEDEIEDEEIEEEEDDDEEEPRKKSKSKTSKKSKKSRDEEDEDDDDLEDEEDDEPRKSKKSKKANKKSRDEEEDDLDDDDLEDEEDEEDEKPRKSSKKSKKRSRDEDDEEELEDDDDLEDEEDEEPRKSKKASKKSKKSRDEEDDEEELEEDDDEEEEPRKKSKSKTSKKSKRSRDEDDDEDDLEDEEELEDEDEEEEKPSKSSKKSKRRR